MAALNEYNVVGGLIGLGEFILLEIVSESIDLEDVQQIVFINKKTYKLKDHIRFHKSIDNKINIALSITVPEGDYTKKDDEFTFTSNTTDWLTFPIDCQITRGIYRCEFKISEYSHFIFFGIKKSGLIIPFGQRPQDQPYAKGNMYFLYNGTVKQNDIETYGNNFMKNGDLISVEVNMDIVPRTVKLFINGNLQPIYMSGIPDSIQFSFSLWATGNTITVQSLKRLVQSTDATIQGAKEVKWE
ncbi:MAG: hypothetical protein EZS28_037437 [Streblomastix strix]|uniref:SPRY domain-containing protein n=1 Tax=Streblomastix strix TaxID=222440 RepID=A0A5J4U831_9EUKA|nr:MAG: hypothetical protein EZS28_037437 [Streblomastix strix]